jgi:hypothetical protein
MVDAPFIAHAYSQQLVLWGGISDRHSVWHEVSSTRLRILDSYNFQSGISILHGGSATFVAGVSTVLGQMGSD